LTEVFITGVGMTRFARHPERSLQDLAGEALDIALKDSGCSKGDLETAFYSAATNGLLQGQDMIPGQIVLSKIGAILRMLVRREHLLFIWQCRA